MLWAFLASTASVQVATSSVVTAFSAWVMRGVFSDAAEAARAAGRAEVKCPDITEPICHRH
eukprot:8088424-Pyramimonas_sp.AAC.1